MHAPATPIYQTPAEALALVLDIAAPERRELFLRSLRHRFTLTEPTRDRHPLLTTPIHEPD